MALIVALAAAAGCERGPRRQPEPGPRTASPPRPDAAATPPPARPAVALIYGSDLRGRVSAAPSAQEPALPPGIQRTPLSARATKEGLARRATLVDRARLGATAVVQVDAGDLLPRAGDEPRDPAGPDQTRGIDLVLAAYRRLGVDAVTLGERELVPAADLRKLAARFAKAHVPVVLANLVDRKGAAVFPADKLLDAGGVSVGIFGVSELLAEETAALAKAGYVLGDPVAAARTAAQGLRARGAALVVGLVHAAGGRARAAAIVAGLTDVDVAVASLDGGAPSDAGVKDGTPRPLIVGADAATALGRIDVRPRPGHPPALVDTLTPLDERVPEQLGVGLLTRVATIPLIDTDKLLAAMKKKRSGVRMSDIYENWDYGSTKSCGYCHEKAVKQWEGTEHATALATLKKRKHDRDPACLGCHVMGFLQPGGTRDWIMIAGGFANIGCESCHGPSALHVRSVNKKEGTSRAVDPMVCLGCHTPDQNIGSFDPIAATKEILGPGHGAP